MALVTTLWWTLVLGGGEGLAIAPPDDDRFPAERWLQYADVGEAGFSPDQLAEARLVWESLDSCAFLAVSGGAVVAAWGDVDRRYMCHSVRKSFLSALYGVFEGEIDLEATLEELGIDDDPPLTDAEKQARVIDLIRSRSGVYHPAAYEPDSMSRDRPARGSSPPGRRFWYNNWDFNTAMVVFEQETGEPIFEAFRDAIADPIGMQDYRVRDGYYHLELHKSIHPAYPFRMSTRDMARFGLLFARGGRWGDRQILSEGWVEESTTAVDSAGAGRGYGAMWWVDGSREEPESFWFSARGSGGQTIGVSPARDLVLVIRADTYRDRSVSTADLWRLFGMVAGAKLREAVDDPELVPLADVDRPTTSFSLSADELARYAAEVTMESGRKVVVSFRDGRLDIDFGNGSFALRPLGPTRFVAEDAEEPVLFERDDRGRVTRIWTERLCFLEALAARDRGEIDRVVAWVRHAAEKFPDSVVAHLNLARVLADTGDRRAARDSTERVLELEPEHREARALLQRLREADGVDGP